MGISSVTVPWATLVTSVVLYILIPVGLAQLWRRSLLKKSGAFEAAMKWVGPWSIGALLATLEAMGAETRVFDPKNLPLRDGHPESHPKVQELRSLAAWSEGMVWCSPERHGSMTGVLKAQIDWIPLSIGSIRPTQGKTLTVMEVSGGSQSFNAVDQLRVLSRWMRMLTIPNQSLVAKAFLEFDEDGRMKPSSWSGS